MPLENHRVLLVIPCLRESERIGGFLEALCSEMERIGDVRVLVIDDGSGEVEVAKMRELIQTAKRQHQSLDALYELPENIGKGGAIYAGWDSHHGESWLMFADADGAVSAAEISRVIQIARTENLSDRAYFGSRIKMLGRSVKHLLRRHLMGRIYATLVSEMLDLPVYDSQCGCKLVPRHKFEQAHSQLTLKGFAFDVDLLMALRQCGTDVVEVPVDWVEIPGGNIRLLRDSWLMFKDVLSLRRRWR